MFELIALCEVRTLMTEALQVVNDVGEDAPPELHIVLQRTRHHLHFAIKSIDRATDPDPGWPRGPEEGTTNKRPVVGRLMVQPVYPQVRKCP